MTKHYGGMVKDYDLFIANEHVRLADQEYFSAINPYTGQEWARVPQASADQVKAAIEAARNTYETVWKRTTGYQRSRLMLRLAELLEANADRMATLESTDNGKCIKETSGQMISAARAYRFFAGLADKLSGQTIPTDMIDTFDYTHKEALGVCVLITAWNSPMALLSNKLAPALAAGNCVVIKPSEHASVTTLEFAALAKEAGFPAGVINVVTGDYRVGQALTRSGRVDKVSFTGSASVGGQIAADAGARLIPVTLELGGKSPNIIFDDAELDRAIPGALAGIFSATGQTCIAGSRLFVQRGVYDKVWPRLVERAKQIRLGNPMDPNTQMGTAANELHFNRILAAIDKAKVEGARLVCGGGRAMGEGLESGFFVEPTIFIDVRNDMELAREEIFGPVLSVIPFDSEEEVLALANDSRYGLAAGIWTTNLSRMLRVSRAVDAGMVWVNTYRVAQSMVPFGGFKDSGFGKERGTIAVNEYLRTKNVMIDFATSVRDPFA